MKITFFIIGCLLLTFSVKAQFSLNDKGEIIPFVMSQKYKNLIDTSKVNICKLKSYNNDSLYIANNKNNKGEGEFVGFSIDTLIDLKAAATKYKIKEGTVWLYKIESKTAEMLDIKINQLIIPDGAYICLFPKQSELNVLGPKLFSKKNIKTPFIGYNYGNQLFVEYFEPNRVDKKASIKISSIGYTYASPFKKKENAEIRSDNSEGHLKSGNFGSTTNPCQKNVVCTEVSAWTKESRSIVYIYAWTYLSDGSKFNSQGTGFFINKSIGYSNSDRPFLISCGHVFAPWTTINGTLTNVDFTTNPSANIEYRVNYRDETCTDPEIRTGQSLIGNFNFIAKGNSYNKNQATDPTFEENEDYAILQSSTTIPELKVYNILYAGWTADPNFYLSGYAAIGHPSGDVQKVLVENGQGELASNGRSVDFNNIDLGVAEKGFSGSPVFNANKKVVGWISRGNGNATCGDVGTSFNFIKCGNFNHLYFNISPYIDPTSQRQWADSEPTPPVVSLPTHCSNCIRDADETGIDCGGSCLPCGMKDIKTLKNQADITSSNITARYELNTEPDPGYQLVFVSGDFNLTAGNDIKLKNNTVIKAGVTLKAAVVPSLMSEPPRGCQAACIDMSNVFTPDGDGVNDYWIFNQAFVKSYSFYVTACNSGTIIFSKATTSIYENGTVYAWDGTGATKTCSSYYIWLTYTDCYGITRNTTKNIGVFGLKSLNLNEYQDKITTLDTKIEEDKTFNIKAYPNPTGGRVSIEANDCNLLFDYILTDMTGKVLSKSNSILGFTELDLSGYPSGTYLLRVKTGENIQLCKLIKK